MPESITLYDIPADTVYQYREDGCVPAGLYYGHLLSPSSVVIGLCPLSRKRRGTCHVIHASAIDVKPFGLEKEVNADLLAACEAVVEFWEPHRPRPAYYDTCQAAIAKAKTGAPDA